MLVLDVDLTWFYDGFTLVGCGRVNGNIIETAVAAKLVSTGACHMVFTIYKLALLACCTHNQ